jgi:hypothetical protein
MMEVGFLGALTVAMTPSPPLVPASMDHGGLDASVVLSPVTIWHLVSLSDEVNEVDVVAPNYDALLTKEVCDFLVSLS